MFLSLVNVCINTKRQKCQISALETYERGKNVDRYATNLQIKTKFSVTNNVSLNLIFFTTSYYNVFVGDVK